MFISKIKVNEEVNFNDITVANYAYTKCEEFIRSCETANSNFINENHHLNNVNNEINLYDEYVAEFDYYIVGCVLSLNEDRIISFKNYVEEINDGIEKNERAYNWLIFNAVYENYSMYILEVFKHQYITKDRNADVWKGFENWVRSTKNDDGTFTFFSDTQQPLTIR